MAFRDDVRPDKLVPLEEELLGIWTSEKTFEKSVEARRGAQPFVFYEGPPTANGKPGLHHVLSRSIKDFACRLQTMKGRLVERKAGWDTHGLPVEIAAEKKLGFEGKEAIEKFGIAKFNDVCRASVFEYLKDWETMTRRTGYWVDFASAYVTCSNEYVESLWAILADFHRRGLFYKGPKIVPYCPRCETPLSSHEVGQGFKDVQDPSVFVRFRALADDGGELPESFLVWTTTPWTLPSNVALAVHPDVDYVKVRLSEGGGKTEVLWLAQARLSALKAKPDAVAVLETVKGAALVGRRYRRLVDFYDVEATPLAFTVRPATFVTTEDGSGIVHMAPAYGEDDAAVGRRDRLPTLHPVDGRGRFVEGRNAALVAGKFVKDADKDVLRHLKEQGLLFRQETVVHSYPHCWRCDTPLLYYARESWYLATTRFRERMIEFNDEVTWYPEATGSGRFGEWLKNNVDWAISRDRYWGTPLPIWVCDVCARQEAVGSMAELKAKAGRLPAPLDLHRPHVDALTWACGRPGSGGSKGCAGTLRRTPEVADVWFDSGAMPFAQWHAPFENAERVAREVPADFIAEAVDQTRGWFYVLLAVSTMYVDKPPFRTVVCNDMILDGKGKKMSKSKGNVVEPMGLVARHGADVVRWHFLVARPVWQTMRFDEADLVDVRNRVFGTLASIYAFFALYANADGFTARDADALVGKRPAATFDRWLLSRLHGLVADVSNDVSGYDTCRAGRRIAEFLAEDLSNWYVRRNRRRFWKGALTTDKREAYATLRTALLTVCRLMAPIAPFLADTIHRALMEGAAGAGGAAASVHLASWPRAKDFPEDEDLETEMAFVRTVVSLGHAARSKAGVKVRTPIAEVRVSRPSHLGISDQRRIELRDLVTDELNAKAYRELGGVAGAKKAALNKKVAAPRLGALTAPASAALAALSSEAVAELERALVAATRKDPEATVDFEVAGTVIPLGSDDFLVTVDDVAGVFGAYQRGIYVGIDATITPELRAEGLARELVHGLQALRKSKGFDVSDRVSLVWKAEGELAAAIAAHAAYVAGEVLAVEMRRDDALADGDALEVEGAKALVRLARATA